VPDIGSSCHGRAAGGGAGAAAGPTGQDTVKVTLSALEKSELEPAFTR